jgi:hypothetical protein
MQIETNFRRWHIHPSDAGNAPVSVDLKRAAVFPPAPI